MIDLMLCCNNERGNFTSKLDKIEFHYKSDMLVSFESHSYEYICRITFLENNVIKFNNKREFRYILYTPYVGNIMWDCCHINPMVANEIWEYLLTMKDKIHIDEAIDEFWNAWGYGLKVDFLRLEKENL